MRLCLGKDRQKPLAMHFAHLCQVAQPYWKCGFPVSTCSSVAPSFLSLHCFHILSHCLPVWCSLPHPSTFICISSVQGNIMIGCQISHRRESHSQQDPRKWKVPCRYPTISLLCAQPLPSDRIEVLYVDYAFLIVIRWLKEIASAYLVLTRYQTLCQVLYTIV